jgi:dTMP kinase
VILVVEPPSRSHHHDEPDPSEIVAESLRALRERQPDPQPGRPPLKIRVFGSDAFFRLWLTQAIISLGDWLGFLAIVILAADVGAGAAGASVGVVMAARIIPGFFFAAGAGALIDRMDRKQVMVATCIARAFVVASLPFVGSVVGLVFASLLLEIATLFYSPAKEAAVPGLVDADKLTSANSLSLAAAYGTFPIASALFALLAKVAEWLGHFEFLDFLDTNRENVAFGVNVITYVIAAVIIATIPISRQHMRQRESDEGIDLGQVFKEIKEGWSFIFITPVVRAVVLGLGCGLIGGGMLVPLGPEFSRDVLGAGTAGFGIFVTALGLGVAFGVIAVSLLQRRLPKSTVFSGSVVAAGITLFLAASMGNLGAAAVFVTLMGVWTGAVYVLGFTLLHENVEDELRGRTFAGLYTMVRLCVLVAFAVGPFLSEGLDSLSDSLLDGHLSLGGAELAVPGVRLTLWLAGLIMVVAGTFSALALRSWRRSLATPGHPAAPAPES